MSSDLTRTCLVETARVVPLWGVEMGAQAERKALVQNFRRLAQRYDVPRVSDTASKAAVVISRMRWRWSLAQVCDPL